MKILSRRYHKASRLLATRESLGMDRAKIVDNLSFLHIGFKGHEALFI